MFPEDIMAGMMLVVSIILFVVSSVAYRRYHLKGMLLALMAFLAFFVEAVVYIVNIFLSLHLDMMFLILLLNLLIMFMLYFSISLKR